MYRGMVTKVDYDIHKMVFCFSQFFVIAISLLTTTIAVAFINKKKQLNVSLTKKAGATVKSWMYRINVGVQFVLSLSAIFATFALSNQLKYWNTTEALDKNVENVYDLRPDI